MRAIIYDRIRLMGIPIREAYAPPTKISARPDFFRWSPPPTGRCPTRYLRHSSVNKLVIAVARDTSNYDHGDVCMRRHIFAYIPHATATPSTVRAAGSSMLAPARSLTLAERWAQPRIRLLRSLSYERDQAARLSPRARAVRARLAARSGDIKLGALRNRN